MRRCLLLMLAIVFAGLPAAVPAGAAIVVNEIMYDSNYSPDIEYVELYNTGPTAQNLVDWYIIDSKNTSPKCYLTGTLGVGQYLVVAADTAYFRARYPSVTNLSPVPFDQGGAGFGLNNTSDAVRVYDDNGAMRDSVTYQNSGAWPNGCAGTGPSLELVNPFLDNAVPTSWAASVDTGGTPGRVNSTYAANAAPACRDGARSIALPTAADAVTVTVRASDSEGHLAGVALWVNTGAGFVSQPMYDDGAHGDGAAADSVFGAVIPAHANDTVVKYYAVGTDNLSQSNAWPSDAPTDYRAYTVGYVPPVLVVNEIVASNTSGVLDDHGEREDWVEIHNPGTGAVDLGGMYLTDDLSNGNKWEIPAGVSVAAGGYVVFWADEQTEQGSMHADLKLSASGEEIGIFGARDRGNTRINGWKFGPVAPNVAVGYRPDGKADDGVCGSTAVPEYLATPTPGASNVTSALYSPVCINEFQTTSLAGGIDDWIELYNRGTSAVNLGGMFLSDNRSSNTKYRIPTGTILAAGGYVVFDESQFGFNLGTTGEVIVLTAADSTSGLDFYDFTQESPDTSEGRAPDGTGRWTHFPHPTKGSANVGAAAVESPVTTAGLELSSLRVVPNPLRTGGEVRFDLGRAGLVAATVHDAAGRQICQLYRGSLEAGSHRLQWDGRSRAGRPVAPGTYFVRVSTAQMAKTYTVVVLK